MNAFYEENMVAKFRDFREGALPADEVVPLFQSLVETGLAWQLPSSVGRFAEQLIDEGLVKPTLQ